MMDHSSHHMSSSMTAGMDHSMPDMHDGDKCSMNMLFTWDWKNTCVIFKWWHIRTFTDFLLSFLAVVLLTLGYEFLKYWVNKWERAYVNVTTGSASNTNSALIKQFRLKQSVFYGLQVGYSFMLMLIFMTYSGWLMIAVVVGGALGKYIWGSSFPEPSVGRSLACH